DDRRRAGAHQRDRGPRTTVRPRCTRPDGRAMTAQAQPMRPSEIVDVFLVAAEESGDRLGAALIRALRERTAGQVRFVGAGGREMAAEGIASRYPIEDLPIIGFSALPRRQPRSPRPQ